MHNKVHGLVPNKIIEVSNELVEAFLGRIYDPGEAETTKDGLKVFSNPSFRVLIITQITDPALLKYKLGADRPKELLSNHNSVIRQKISENGGREAEHEGA